MKLNDVKPIGLFLLIAFVALVCSGVENKTSDQKSETKMESQSVEDKKAMTPGEIGDQIAELYIQSLKDVTDQLKDKPSVSNVRLQVEALKENYVKQLVEYGRLRENLDSTGRAAVDSRIRMALNAIYNESWYAVYNDVQQHYFRDRDFHNLVMSFNIIGQYANFDLLKKQEPEEAKRLGID